MSSQAIAVDVCCFDGIEDINKLLEELRQSDPAAYVEAMEGLKDVNWEAVRKQIGRESLKALAQEKGWSFFDGHAAQEILRGSTIPPENAKGELIGIVCAGFGNQIQLGLTMAANETCSCFGTRTDSSAPYGRGDRTTVYEKKPKAQERFEQLHRDRVAEAMMKIILGTDADEVKVTDKGATIMRFPIQKKEV